MKRLLVFCFFLVSSISVACVCMEMGTKENEIEKTDVLLTAKVLAIESFSESDKKITGLISRHTKCKVKVIAIHKGKVANEIMTVATSNGDCGFRFENGKTYIIYAYRHKDKIKDKYIYTSNCTRTSKFSLHEFKKITKYCKSKGYS